MQDLKLYQQELLEHYKNPRHKGKIVNPDISSGVLNPSCGDSVQVQAKVKDNKIAEIKFQGSGCVISQAVASMLTEQILGKDLDSILKLDKNFMLSLVKIPLGPNRLRCALLALEALHKGINKYKESFKQSYSK